MGYDYHYAGSDVGASAPMDRRDGEEAGPAVVARPVRVARRAGRADDPRPAAVRDALAGRRAGDRRVAARRRRHLGARRQPEVPRRPTDAARVRPDRDRRVLRRRADGQPACRATRGRPPAGRRSTSICRETLRAQAGASPTSAAWPVPGSGRSATSAGCPAITAAHRPIQGGHGPVTGARTMPLGDRASPCPPARTARRPRSAARVRSAAARGPRPRRRHRPGPSIAPVQTGVYSAASRMPTTAAFVPDSARRKPTEPRSQSQNGQRAEDQQERRQEDRDQWRCVAPGDAVRGAVGDGAEVRGEREQRPRARPARRRSRRGTASSLTQPGSTTRACAAAAGRRGRRRTRARPTGRTPRTGRPPDRRRRAAPAGRSSSAGEQRRGRRPRRGARSGSARARSGRRRWGARSSRPTSAPPAMIATCENGVVQSKRDRGGGHGDGPARPVRA